MTCPDLSDAQERLAELLRPLAGCHIALIAPAGGVSDAHIDQTLRVLAAAGITAHSGAHIRAHHRYLAGRPSQRLSDLQAAFELPDITAVWCLRGGYGCAHLLDHIDWRRIPPHIPLIGYSDVTALLEAFRQHGRYGIHGPTANALAMPGTTRSEQDARARSLQSLVTLLLHPPSDMDWPLQPGRHAVDQCRSGQLVGGNLTVLASLAGTAASLQLPDKAILLLEDVQEAEFRLERCFHQLLTSIDRRRLQAVCLGQFRDCRLANGLASLRDILEEWLTPHAIPVYTGLPIGHGHCNHAWADGTPAVISKNHLFSNC